MNNETRELLKVVISSSNSKMNYINNISEQLELKKKSIDTREKRDLNPLYLVGDVADWTFGKSKKIFSIKKRAFLCRPSKS